MMIAAFITYRHKKHDKLVYTDCPLRGQFGYPFAAFSPSGQYGGMATLCHATHSGQRMMPCSAREKKSRMMPSAHASHDIRSAFPSVCVRTCENPPP